MLGRRSAELSKSGGCDSEEVIIALTSVRTDTGLREEKPINLNSLRSEPNFERLVDHGDHLIALTTHMWALRSVKSRILPTVVITSNHGRREEKVQYWTVGLSSVKYDVCHTVARQRSGPRKKVSLDFPQRLGKRSAAVGRWANLRTVQRSISAATRECLIRRSSPHNEVVFSAEGGCE
jgi:hypothetical protein